MPKQIGGPNASALTVRPLRSDEGRTYLDVVNRAIRGVPVAPEVSSAAGRVAPDVSSAAGRVAPDVSSAAGRVAPNFSSADCHYTPEAIAGWIVPVTDETLRDLVRNPDREIRLVAELEDQVVGIGALILERAELRACYVVPEAARRGCGTALVREMERIAREHGLARLQLAASLNAEPFYAANGYVVTERSEVVLRNGHRMAAVWMAKSL